jgi:nucleoside-diphosphate-sugar epimerase
VPATDRAAGLGLRPWVSLEDGIRRTCEWRERIRAGKGAGS